MKMCPDGLYIGELSTCNHNLVPGEGTFVLMENCDTQPEDSDFTQRGNTSLGISHMLGQMLHVHPDEETLNNT